MATRWLDIFVSSDRPKSIAVTSMKLPEELLDDLKAFGLRHSPPKSVGDVVKDCCEFRLSMIKGLRIGYYHLRTLPDDWKAEVGTTK